MRPSTLAAMAEPLCAEVAGDHGVVARGGRKGQGRHAFAEGEIHAACFNPGTGLVIVPGVGHHEDAVEVLGRGAQQAGAADIDFLHHVAEREFFFQCGGEVVKIHAHQIKRCDVVFLQCGEVFGLVLVGQDAAVNFGVHEDTFTLRENIRAFNHKLIVPHTLRNVENPSTEIEFDGDKLSSPIILAPVADHKLANVQGEVAS